MQHHDKTGPLEVRDLLMAACAAWEIAGCPCCSENVLDAALEGLSFEDWRRLGAFADGLTSAARYRRDDAAGCTCPESMDPCPLHNTALVTLLTRKEQQ